VDAAKVYRTTDAGATWTDLTGNLLALGGVVLRSAAYCDGLAGGSVAVGANGGVFVAPVPTFSTWSRLGTGLPAAPSSKAAVCGLPNDAV
jgi:photosystem II stability/assembly factor-like uncharacterized protein